MAWCWVAVAGVFGQKLGDSKVSFSTGNASAQLFVYVTGSGYF